MLIKKFIPILLLMALLPMHDCLAAVQDIPFIVAKQSNNAVTYSLSIKILAVVTLLTILPALLITSTAFTRVIIVLAILRQAIGIPNVPSNQILIGLSLIMTIFIMMPIVNDIHDKSITPFMAGTINEEKALTIASESMKKFMLKQTRKSDIKLFMDLSRVKPDKAGDYSFIVVLPAYITSELKTAFEIGFLIFIPFLIIDLVTASILMSMGMMMLSPMIISLPFKILFFVLVDGWNLIVMSLVTSFRM